jgi:hypothetical protein
MKINKEKCKLSFVLFVIIMFAAGCVGKTNFLSKFAVPLRIEEVNIDDINTGGENPGGNTGENAGGKTGYQDIPSNPSGGLHPIFGGTLGMPVSMRSLSAVAPDPSGLTALTDYDGDGIPNDQELTGFSNMYVSEVPRITMRVDTPITMELHISNIDMTLNYTEVISNTDTKDTITNSMENRQYNQLNKRTTPYVTKNSDSMSTKDAGSEGYYVNSGATVGVGTSQNTKEMTNDSYKESSSSQSGASGFSMNINQNKTWDRELSQSTMSEKTVFEDVNYIDNLNRNGVEFKNDTVQNISKNFRQSAFNKSTTEIGPNVGYVRAGLYIANESKNLPVRISNVICTLSFLTPSGKCLPVKTFRLRNDDYSEFDQEIYGGQELGPYTIAVEDLNTVEVKNALRCGYVPQIHVVSYDMTRVHESNYNPGVENLKTVEETAKARTAIIKITGKGMREMYRVPALDVDANGNASPGVSLKKALFRIYAARTGNGESWPQAQHLDENGMNVPETFDSEGKRLTVPDNGLKWRSDFIPAAGDPGEYRYDPDVDSEDMNKHISGNTWRNFSTYLKTYVVLERDADGKLVEKMKRIETIERIGSLKKYNPFMAEDNPAYDQNDPLSLDEFYKMKYWLVLHNGRYYEGDINDPIWAGERYEIIMFDARDFNERFQMYAYAPLNRGTERDLSSVMDTQADFNMNTIWNSLTNNKGELSRSVYLGRIVAGDVVKLDIKLNEFRSLFNINQPGMEFGDPKGYNTIDGRFWQNFNYTFDSGDPLPTGIPGNFSYKPWGGCNSIDLWIEQSANARFYTVTFWNSTSELGENGPDKKIAYVSSKALNESSGFITINRNTPGHVKDTQGNEYPGGPLGVIPPANYMVKVRAHGVVYNVPVATLSASGTTIATVSDPPANYLPSRSSKKYVEGSLNNIDVMIEQDNYTEYYFIDIKGPMNYGNGNGMLEGVAIPVNRVIGHAGMNSIPIPNLENLDDDSIVRAASLTDDEKKMAVPGVYEVKIFPVNKNCYIDGIIDPTKLYELSGGPINVLVDYNRYEDQRYDANNKKYAPLRQFEEFNPKDADLEVNFNEGSGWFRLALSHDDVATEDRIIDCRYTTHFVSSEGRVIVYFSGPSGYLSGGQNTLYDVFRGGAKEVDVYLRTVAKLEYRDTLWLKPNSGADQNLARRLYINSNINDLPDCDPLKYWMNSDATDVTRIENYNENPRVFNSFNSFLQANSIGQNDFGVISRGKRDFFFSPAKNLTYNISASLVEADLNRMMTEFTHVDNPKYRVTRGEDLIKLSNLDTQYGDRFRISMTTKTDPLVMLFTPVEFSITSSGPHTFDITQSLVNIAPNEEYLVCVEAGNASKDVNGNDLPAVFSSKVYRIAKPGQFNIPITVYEEYKVDFSTNGDTCSMYLEAIGSTTVTWHWSDGSTSTGLSVTKTGLGAGDHNHYVSIDVPALITQFGVGTAAGGCGHLTAIGDLNVLTGLKWLFVYQESGLLSVGRIYACTLLNSFYINQTGIAATVMDQIFADMVIANAPLTNAEWHTWSGGNLLGTVASYADRTTLISRGWGTPSQGNGIQAIPSPNYISYSVFNPGATPGNPYWASGSEVGMKFRVTIGGYITALRFYRSASNPGTSFVGHLWRADGTLLAQANYPTGTPAGWQQVNLTSPVPIAANTTYVVSFYCTTGGFSFDHSYFTTSNEAAYRGTIIYALRDGEEGGNGVYLVGGGFPTNTNNLSTKYWVDVVFSQPAP